MTINGLDATKNTGHFVAIDEEEEEDQLYFVAYSVIFDDVPLVIMSVENNAKKQDKEIIEEINKNAFDITATLRSENKM